MSTLKETVKKLMDFHYEILENVCNLTAFSKMIDKLPDPDIGKKSFDYDQAVFISRTIGDTAKKIDTELTKLETIQYEINKMPLEL